MKVWPPFRLIGIAGERSRLLSFIQVCSRFPDVPVGLMLRDPGHDSEAVARLADDVGEMELPPHITLITNARSTEGIGWRHLTSKELEEGVIPSESFGVSAHTAEEAKRAERIGASYVTFGPVFPTRSKPGTEPAGVSGLAACVAAIDIPLFALGGIDSTEKCASCLAAGAYGVAGITLAGNEDLLGRLLPLLIRTSFFASLLFAPFA